MVLCTVNQIIPLILNSGNDHLLQVLIGILIPPYILALEFKSKEELQLMPQTMEEHLDELEDDASEENVSVDSFEDDQVFMNNSKFNPIALRMAKTP